MTNIMNNTKTLAIVAVLTAATLVVGVTVRQQQQHRQHLLVGHKERQDKYMKGEQDGYKKEKQANGKYNGAITVTQLPPRQPNKMGK